MLPQTYKPNRHLYILQGDQKVKFYETQKEIIKNLYAKLLSALIEHATSLEEKRVEIKKALSEIKEVTASCHQVIYFLIVNHYLQKYIHTCIFCLTLRKFAIIPLLR